MKRMSFSAGALVCALGGGLSPLILTSCVGPGAEDGETPVASGRLSVPLTAQADGKTYRLSNLSIHVAGPAELWLYGGENPAETALVATLPTGSYQSDLENYSLERQDDDGKFQPVVAELVSDSHHDFSLLNGTTTTISYQFETDGHIVSVGVGSLRVEVGVSARPGACTPLGSDCDLGAWCAPSELTGAPVACVPTGPTELGERCSSHTDCIANSSCYDFGDGARCAALCAGSEFGEACSAGGICASQGADYGVCAPEGVAGPLCPLTRRLWETSNVTDAVFDGARCQIYAATGAGSIVRHSLADQRSETLIGFGSPLRGLDLSPDGSALVAADATTILADGFDSSRVHVVDIDEQSSRELRFPLWFNETGTYMPVFVDDGTLLVSSSSWSGSTPLRRVNLLDDSTEVFQEVLPNTMLATSADGNFVAYAAAYSAEFGLYSIPDWAQTATSSNVYLSTIAVNRDGTQVALPTSGGLLIYEHSGAGLNLVATLQRAGNPYAVGAVYSPNSDVLYVAWGGYDSTIEAIGTTDRERLFGIDQGLSLGYGAAFGPGRLRISPDGKLLLLLVSNGVMTYPVQFN
jgi:hypothetical protein